LFNERLKLSLQNEIKTVGDDQADKEEKDAPLIDHPAATCRGDRPNALTQCFATTLS
jgi:hypothetical protein